MERLAGVLRPAHAVFWLHDYAALCEGFNLLRNDVAYCGAPPVGSTACRICVYGAERAAYLAAMGRLFAAVGFHVLAPSRVATLNAEQQILIGTLEQQGKTAAELKWGTRVKGSDIMQKIAVEAVTAMFDKVVAEQKL